MNFEFNKNLQGFEGTSLVELSNVKFQGESALHCRCNESGDQIGVSRLINLPNLTQYNLKVTGQANNDRTYIKVTDYLGNSLSKQKLFFKKNKRQNLSLKFYGRVNRIKIHILMGGDSIAVRNNSFLIFRIRLTPVSSGSSNPDNSSKSLKITRIFETVLDLEREKNDPLRNNQTPMEPGEYAILQESDDLYILTNRQGLKYVSRIGPGLPVQTLGEPIRPLPGRIIPIYSNPQEAQEILNQNPAQFYSSSSQEYSWNSKNQNNDVYIYLDSDGYVRWLKYKSEK